MLHSIGWSNKMAGGAVTGGVFQAGGGALDGEACEQAG